MPIAFTATVLRTSLATATDRIARLHPQLVRLSVEHGQAWLSAQARDNDLYLSCKLKGKVAGHGAVILSKFTLLRAHANSSADTIIFKAADNVLEITAGRARSKHSASPDDGAYVWPKCDELCALSLPLFQDLVRHVAFACPNQVNKFQQPYILVESTGTVVRAVATDSFRIAIYEPPFPATVCAFLIGPGATRIVAGLSGLILQISASETHLFFATDDSVLMTELVPVSQFMPYQHVLPQMYLTGLIVVEKRALRQAIRYVLVNAEKQYSPIVFAVAENSAALMVQATRTEWANQFVNDDLLTLSADNEIEATVIGPSVSFALNGKYLLEYLNRAPDRFAIRVARFKTTLMVDFFTDREPFRYLQMVLE